ncbi:hypothetical protein NUW54_g14582 [Trametes sanguinea]|uniref:Uncharacterized protein n=1 Tax=Trametes sanguinea TaxID=158606 RepID=A0ACC1MC74_9APHY|nr:hypothetical protein NUW54_g14582 [Trametes sanguinea]
MRRMTRPHAAGTPCFNDTTITQYLHAPLLSWCLPFASPDRARFLWRRRRVRRCAIVPSTAYDGDFEDCAHKTPREAPGRGDASVKTRTVSSRPERTSSCRRGRTGALRPALLRRQILCRPYPVGRFAHQISLTPRSGSRLLPPPPDLRRSPTRDRNNAPYCNRPPPSTYAAVRHRATSRSVRLRLCGQDKAGLAPGRCRRAAAPHLRTRIRLAGPVRRWCASQASSLRGAGPSQRGGGAVSGSGSQEARACITRPAAHLRAAVPPPRSRLVSRVSGRLLAYSTVRGGGLAHAEAQCMIPLPSLRSRPRLSLLADANASPPSSRTI